MVGANAKAMLETPTVLKFDPDYERKALQALSEWSTKFSPFVAPDKEESLYDPRSSGLYLDVSGSKLLFGSLEELIQSVSGELARLGFSSRLAITPSYGASWALARYGRKRTNLIEERQALRSALAPLPVPALKLSKAIEASLGQLNISRIEHLFSLPQSELNKRFDGLLTSRLKICLGEKEESIKTIRLPKKARVNLVFDGLLTEQSSFVEAIKK